jgi:hypothetical protein
VIEIKNLLFQPLTLHLAGSGRGLHLNPRERRTIGEGEISAEIEAASRRGLVALTGGSTPPETVPHPKEPLDEPPKPEPGGGGTPKSKRRKRR